MRQRQTVENMRVQFEASNLANERYLSAANGDQGGTFFLGPARILTVTLGFEFWQRQPPPSLLAEAVRAIALGQNMSSCRRILAA